MQVLLIDDDHELGELLREYLGAEGFDVEQVMDGAEGLRRALCVEHDVVVLDVMLPSMSGLDVMRNLQGRRHAPVLMLTARGEDIDRVVGLELGADDYLPKPFNPRELVARLRAVTRRYTQDVPERLQVGEVSIDPATHTAELGGRALDLTSSELAVLEVLMRNAGHVVSREKLAEEALDKKLAAFDRSVDVHVSNLRKKIGAEIIRTVRESGYLYAAR